MYEILINGKTYSALVFNSAWAAWYKGRCFRELPWAKQVDVMNMDTGELIDLDQPL